MTSSPRRAADTETFVGVIEAAKRAPNPCPKPEKRTKGRRHTSKSERKQLEKKLWQMASLYIRKRDRHCVTCGATEGLTMSHYIKAGKQRIRYDERNVNCQCSTCNNYHNYYPHVYEGYMRRVYGCAVLDELEELAKGTKWKWTVLDLRQMLADYQNKLESLS